MTRKSMRARNSQISSSRLYKLVVPVVVVAQAILSELMKTITPVLVKFCTMPNRVDIRYSHTYAIL
jgi:hypothetical protein